MIRISITPVSGPAGLQGGRFDIRDRDCLERDRRPDLSPVGPGPALLAPTLQDQATVQQSAVCFAVHPEKAALDGFKTLSPNGRPLGGQDFIAMVAR